MSKFWSDLVQQLNPYIPGEQPKIDGLIKLNTNENPYPPSAKVYEAISRANNIKLALYPDPDATELKESIANYYKVKIDQIFVGNGSDEVLAHIFLALLKKESPLLLPDISYSFYSVYCSLYQINYKIIPLDNKFRINPIDYKVNNGAIIFPNPNAPTGILLSLNTIEEILTNNLSSVVVVDEAYIDFGGKTSICLINKYPNLLVVQTFSKSRSLAGLRVGFAIGNKQLISALEIVKNSFNSYPMNRLSMPAAIAAIKDEKYFQQTNTAIIKTRAELTKFLTNNDFSVISSMANFVFAKHKSIKAKTIANKLREQKIIVRYFDKQRINKYLRISIGTEKQNSLLCNSLKKILAE